MKLEWFDDGEQCLTALGTEYNYTVLAQPKRGWMVEQTWYRTDLDDTILLKKTWAESASKACELAQGWENGYDSISFADTGRSGRLRLAARRTRERRAGLARRTQAQKETR